ncbi:polymorphic toxin-type HINT domain-containing protein [Anatilimnocola floriformis]|uniref:polymorphic toxin-type HINT domain-containing protein n=1 Tax=Anatilimnocola floriformis TaxID=2948575 RepID=UPI0020C3DE91|nr:polymorphic toxin-type HINT domain-containing protein [Anatilimnocola floriformis]
MNAGTGWSREYFSLLSLAVLPALSLAVEKVDKASAIANDAVREALQREVYGLDVDREQLLSAALEQAPDNAAARWQHGYVRSTTGEWVKLDDRSDKKRQSLLKGYENQRANSKDTVVDQLELADWCGKHFLREQERVHLLRVCELSPDHTAARQRLGFVHIGNDWVLRDEINKQQAQDAAAKKAIAYWTPHLTKLAAQLSASDAAKREAAAAQLKQIHDPAALPAMQQVLGTRGEEMELLVVEATAQMTDPAAIAALARHAVFSPSLFVRHTAATKLQACDRDSYVPMLVSSMFTPVVSQIAEVALPNGRIGYRQMFLREGADRQELLILDTTYQRVAAPGGDSQQTFGVAARDARLTARRLEQAAAAQNRATEALNDRIAWVLNTATQEKLPAVPDEWWTWWNEQNEVFATGSKAVATIQHSRTVAVVEQGPNSLGSGNGTGQAGSGSRSISASGGRMDCLAAGTPVWTERGEVAIEKILAGDLVLSRDIDSGELAFKPVLRTTVRPPGRLVKIQAGNETFETSGGHLFWVSGQGWVKSRQLESGMVLHTATGPTRVAEVSESPVAPTYNLVVADFNNYFVGKQKVLSHDNTVRRPTNVAVPGLKPE